MRKTHFDLKIAYLPYLLLLFNATNEAFVRSEIFSGGVVHREHFFLASLAHEKWAASSLYRKYMRKYGHVFATNSTKQGSYQDDKF
jgi:hypothetical protein